MSLQLKGKGAANRYQKENDMTAQEITKRQKEIRKNDRNVALPNATKMITELLEDSMKPSFTVMELRDYVVQFGERDFRMMETIDQRLVILRILKNLEDSGLVTIDGKKIFWTG